MTIHNNQTVTHHLNQLTSQKSVAKEKAPSNEGGIPIQPPHCAKLTGKTRSDQQQMRALYVGSSINMGRLILERQIKKLQALQPESPSYDETWERANRVSTLLCNDFAEYNAIFDPHNTK